MPSDTHKPVITLELRPDFRGKRWCAECLEYRMHEWHDTSADIALEWLLNNLGLHGRPSSRDAYEIVRIPEEGRQTGD